jgi:PKD repeat protein
MVIVSDEEGCVNQDEYTIEVNQGPVAEFANVSIGPCDMTLAYDGTASSDCNVDDTLRYAWDFNGDNRPDSTDPSGTWAYRVCGEKLVQLIVADDHRCISEPISQLLYANQPPVATLDIPGGDCLTIGYEATVDDCDLSQSSPLYTESVSSEIDFGDGNTTANPAGRHTYETCGSYPVELTATDANGCTGTDLKTVTIETLIDVQ